MFSLSTKYLLLILFLIVIIKKKRKSLQDKIKELEKYIITEDRDDGSVLSDIDPDLNILFNMNDTIQYSSRYYDNCTFRASFNKHTNIFSMLNANIRGMATNLDKFNCFDTASHACG